MATVTRAVPDDTVAWIDVEGTTTLGVYRDSSWWTNIDADDTGISGDRHDGHVDVLRVIAWSADPDRMPTLAPTTSWQHRLHGILEDRRRELGLTQSGIQAAGGPSPRWLQKIPNLEGPPTERMRLPMRRMDAALGWPVGTTWRIANGGDP